MKADVGQPLRFDGAGVKIFRRDFASSYGWWGNLAVVVGRQPPEAVHVANYRACMVELHKRFPAGIGLVTVVNDTSLPSASGRDAMLKMFSELLPLMTAVLLVPNANGFKAAVMRSVMAGVILASRQRDRVHVERTVAIGMPWLTAKLLGPEEGSRQRRTMELGIKKFCDAEAPASSR